MVNQEISRAVAQERMYAEAAAEQQRARTERIVQSREIAQRAGTDLLELAQTIGIDESYKDFRGGIHDNTFSHLIPMGKLDDDEVGFQGETHAFGRVYVLRQQERKTVTTKGRIFRHTEVKKEVTDKIDSFGVAWYVGNEDGSSVHVISDLSWSIPDAGNLELLEDLVKRIEIVREHVTAAE